MASDEQVCTKCHIGKPWSDFNKNALSPSGRRPDCRSCQSLRMKAYRADTIFERKKSSKRYYEAHKSENSARSIAWAKANPDGLKRIQKKNSDKRSSTPRGRLTFAVRTGMRKGLIAGAKASRKTFNLLGYSIDDLISHLERLFQPGMTWKNYGRGGWHVDHKIPLSAHNYETPDHLDFKRAWSLSNLQPLWEADNLSKHDKLDGPFQPSLAL